MMDNKYLWSIIDVLREELSSGTEYGKLQAEINALKKSIYYEREENNHLKKINSHSTKEKNMYQDRLKKVETFSTIENDYDVLKKKYDELKLAIVDQNDDIKTLKKDNKWLANRNGEIIKEKDAWINDLKTENKELKAINYHDEIKDLHKERDNLFKENTKLKAEIKELKQCSNVAFVEVLNRSNDKLKAENDKLKNGWYVTNLQAEIETLKDEAVKWNRKYNQVEYPKDYQKEAKEHFHHNPNCKGVRFHMLDYDDYEYDENDGLNGLSGEYNGSLMAEDCLVEIDNNTTKLKFH